MADPVSASLLVGVGLSATGTFMGAQSKSNAAAKDAGLKEIQAQEVMLSQARQERIMREKGQQLLGAEHGAYAAAGVEISGSPLLQMEKTNAQIEEEINAMKMDTGNKAAALRAGADVSMDLAGDYSLAGAISGFGQLGIGMGNYFASQNKNDGKTLSLGG